MRDWDFQQNRCLVAMTAGFLLAGCQGFSTRENNEQVAIDRHVSSKILDASVVKEDSLPTITQLQLVDTSDLSREALGKRNAGVRQTLQQSSVKVREANTAIMALGKSVSDVEHLAKKNFAVAQVTTVSKSELPLLISKPPVAKQASKDRALVSISNQLEYMPLPAITTKTPSSANQVKLVDLLLAKADEALQKNFLTIPKTKSAYAYYLAVLQLESENMAAKIGMQQIVDAYIRLAQQALVQAEPDKARLYLDRARNVLPESKAIDKAMAVVELGHGLKRQKLPLSINQLRLQEAGLQSWLEQLAQKIKAVDARVMIVVPTDKQGRWIYHTLNNVNEGYRIRANMQYAQSAYLQIIHRGKLNSFEAYQP
jgi:hypothetical protein